MMTRYGVSMTVKCIPTLGNSRVHFDRVTFLLVTINSPYEYQTSIFAFYPPHPPAAPRQLSGT
jgi:hypothetical protein